MVSADSSLYVHIVQDVRGFMFLGKVMSQQLNTDCTIQQRCVCVIEECAGVVCTKIDLCEIYSKQ